MVPKLCKDIKVLDYIFVGQGKRQSFIPALIMSSFYFQKEKKERIWLSPITKAPTPTEKSKKLQEALSDRFCQLKYKTRSAVLQYLRGILKKIPKTLLMAGETAKTLCKSSRTCFDEM